jgi:hypothetical protein
MTISPYWRNQGKTDADRKPGRTFKRSQGSLGCDECCNGDRCDDPTHYNRASCPFCLGTGEPVVLTRNPSQMSPDSSASGATEELLEANRLLGGDIEPGGWK